MPNLLWTTLSLRAIGLFVLEVVLVLVVFVILIFNISSIRQMRAGPQTVSTDYLRQATNPAADGKEWISFTHSGATIDLGGRQLVRQTKVLSSTRVVLLQIGDRWMTAEMPEKREPGPLVGYLENHRSSSVQSMLDERNPTLQGGAASITPCHFQVDYDYAASIRTTLTIVVGILLAGLIAAVTGLGDWIKSYRAAQLSDEMTRDRLKQRKKR
jgi:hypothetical protein